MSVESVITNIANLPSNGKIYSVQPTKSVVTKISNELITKKIEFTTLLETNDPLNFIENDLNSELTNSIFLNSNILIKNLPFLNNLKNYSIIINSEISNNDFSIVSALKDLGYIVLLSKNINELQDLSIVALLLSKLTKQSILHFYSVDSKSNLSKTFSNDSISNLLNSISSSSSDDDDVVVEKSLDESIEFAFNSVKSLGGSTEEFTYSGPWKPKDVLVILGNAGNELSTPAYNANIGTISINLYKPLNLSKLIKLLPSSTEKLLLLEQGQFVNNTQFQSLLLDFFKNIDDLLKIGIKSIIASQLLDVTSKNSTNIISSLIANSKLSKPIQNLTLGSKFKDSNLTIDLNNEKLNSLEKVKSLENSYIKILDQIYGSNLNILNNNNLNLENTGNSTNPEFGFGKYLSQEEKLNEFIDLVHTAITNNSFTGPNASKLIELLSKWLVQVRESLSSSSSSVDSNLIIEYLNSENNEASKNILSNSNLFNSKSNWLIGSDAWSYDLGNSGVHNILSSNKNINMLIIDNDPLNNFKNSNNQRKKDIGLYSMNYGGAYVASVAVYASYTQVLQAFIEAGKFNGPSVVLAYLPFESENDDPLKILKETKKSVDSGFWPLYRYNPKLNDGNNDEESFKLDSSSIKRELKDFLDRENKLTLLSKKNPEFARNLKHSQSSLIKEKQNLKAKEAYSKLLDSLQGAPITIAFASDGGNAENLAKKLGRRSLNRGLKATVLAMDDLSIEDFALEENVCFITSTSGQGEFPQNGKNFWEAIKNSNDLDLATVKISVFGLGDSLYWPRKEDKHYYNKPAKDLFNKLKFLGAQELVPLGLGDDQAADGFNEGYNDWEPKIWEALNVTGGSDANEPAPITNEDMKIGSDFLRGTIVEGLADESTGAICAVDQQLTKFHGIYMQDDRDIRDQRKAEGLEPAYAFMARLRLPGGAASPRQYLKMDELADSRGNGTIKLTTRATFQLHGVVKHDLKAAIRGMNSVLLDTLGACGDVNRNVMISCVPGNAKVHKQMAKTSYIISEHLLPQTTAYHEIWLEGADENDVSPNDPAVWEARKDGPKKAKTLVSGNALVDVEPFYGPTYLPRKFKVVITVPPYNDVDVYAHDVGLIAIVNENNDIIGYNVLAGGGMGTTHNNKKTYPRTGSLLGFAAYDEVHTVCEKIMIVQRDNGDRKNRKHARLKYTIDDMGVDVFRQEVEKLWGKKFEAAKPFEIKTNFDYFGWRKDELGLNHYTLFIENGRIEDTPEFPHKTGLKEIAKYMTQINQGEFRLTGNQHMIISDIRDNEVENFKSLLSKYKLDNINHSALRLSSAACVAFPTCGLAMAESERYLPVLISKIEEALEEYGLRHDSVVMRMTGCPNGCARPWLAEVALVGKAYGAYNLMLGGGHHGQRLNKLYRQSIKEDEILAILKPLFKRWSLERLDGEPFGDFLIRVGVIAETTEGKYFHDNVPEDA
ncbi:catalytic activity protein [[Candida] boidinii]|nr:catalytic activity protein [[Candida] boidinii]